MRKRLSTKWFSLAAALLAWTAAGPILFGTSRPLPPDCTSTPQRIVAAAPSITEILYALDLADHIVGVTTCSNYPPEAAQKPTIGSFWQPDIEKIVAARPDLVITESFDQHAQLANRLARLGCPTLSVDVWTVDDLYDAIAQIGLLTNKNADSTALLEQIKTNIDQVSARAHGPRPRVLYVIQTDPLRVAGRDTFIDQLINLAGGQNAIPPTVQKYPPVGSETVISSRADVIIAPTMTGVSPDAVAAYFAQFPTLPAVANARIHIIDGDILSRLGPRIDEAVRILAACIHPE